jgi:hypothetical protein
LIGLPHRVNLEVKLDGGWTALPPGVVDVVAVAIACGSCSGVGFESRGTAYYLNLKRLVQVNVASGYERPVRVRSAVA